MDFHGVLRSLAEFLEREGHPFALAGAFGLQSYGLPRATIDLDLVTDAAAQPRVIAFLESLGYETLHRSAGYSNHLHPRSAMGRVDFIYVRGETSRQLFAGARRRALLPDLEVPVLRPEHLVAMKVQAIRNDPARRHQDMADLAFLLQLPDIDQDAVREYFARHGMVSDYELLRRS